MARDDAARDLDVRQILLDRASDSLSVETVTVTIPGSDATPSSETRSTDADAVPAGANSIPVDSPSMDAFTTGSSALDSVESVAAGLHDSNVSDATLSGVEDGS